MPYSSPVPEQRAVGDPARPWLATLAGRRGRVPLRLSRIFSGRGRARPWRSSGASPLRANQGTRRRLARL